MTKTLLSVRQVGIDGSEQVTTLASVGEHSYAVQRTPGGRVTLTANDPQVALEEAHVLHIRAEQETFIEQDGQDRFPRNWLLDALQVQGDPVEGGEWAEGGSDVFRAVEETSERWSTAHRVSIDGKPVYGIRCEDGRVEWVPADDPETPHDTWQELLALHWNNVDNAPVGMVTYGVDGLFLVRPGLLAIVVSTDEEYRVTLERVAADVDLAEVVLGRLDAVGHATVLLSALQAHEPEEDDEQTGRMLATSLDEKDFIRIIGALQEREHETE